MGRMGGGVTLLKGGETPPNAMGRRGNDLMSDVMASCGEKHVT